MSARAGCEPCVSRCRYLGEGEAALQQAFRQARAAAPSIVFLDEIDSLFGNRADVEQESQDTQLLSTLLTEMDGLQLATGALLEAAVLQLSCA